jgi:hypothetical protein
MGTIRGSPRCQQSLASLSYRARTRTGRRIPYAQVHCEPARRKPWIVPRSKAEHCLDAGSVQAGRMKEISRTSNEAECVFLVLATQHYTPTRISYDGPHWVLVARKRCSKVSGRCGSPLLGIFNSDRRHWQRRGAVSHLSRAFGCR